MRILLRNVSTGLYLNSGDEMKEAGPACDFKSGGDAITFAAVHRLSNVEIIYSFPEPEYNFCTGIIGFRQPATVSTRAPADFTPQSP